MKTGRSRSDGARKSATYDLAFFGGSACFESPLHVGRPNLPDPDGLLQRIGGVLRSGRLTNGGPEVRQFEQQLCRLLQVSHVIATCNGTTALQLVIQTLGLHGEVILPAFTFPATAHALASCGIRPVFADVEPDCWTLSARSLSDLVTPRTAAILGVHLFGEACDVAALQAVASRCRLQLFFDACHALGCNDRGRSIGQFGAAEVFSFHATKFVSCGEGGAIATNDDKLADELRRARSFGFNEQGDVTRIGINGKLTEVAAAMGRHALDCMHAVVEHNRRNLLAYADACSDLPGFRVRMPRDLMRHNCQYVVLEMDAAQVGLCRDQFLQLLQAENVLARRYFYPGCHRLACYGRDSPPSLPVTDLALERVLVLPTGITVSELEIRRIGELMHRIVDLAPGIRECWPGSDKGSDTFSAGPLRRLELPQDGMSANHLTTAAVTLP